MGNPTAASHATHKHPPLWNAVGVVLLSVLTLSPLASVALINAIGRALPSFVSDRVAPPRTAQAPAAPRQQPDTPPRTVVVRAPRQQDLPAPQFVVPVVRRVWAGEARAAFAPFPLAVRRDRVGCASPRAPPGLS